MSWLAINGIVLENRNIISFFHHTKLYVYKLFFCKLYSSCELSKKPTIQRFHGIRESIVTALYWVGIIHSKIEFMKEKNKFM